MVCTITRQRKPFLFYLPTSSPSTPTAKWLIELFVNRLRSFSRIYPIVLVSRNVRGAARDQRPKEVKGAEDTSNVIGITGYLQRERGGLDCGGQQLPFINRRISFRWWAYKNCQGCPADVIYLIWKGKRQQPSFEKNFRIPCFKNRNQKKVLLKMEA